MVATYKAADLPETIPKVLTETKDLRSHTRVISREVMLKVVRRDGQICQRCNEPVRDDEVEFDHVVPLSRGGRSTAENLRFVHRDCNRRKHDSLREVLHPFPV
jgi:5-methylcytosine-specific restriction endonuclease McrA